MSGSHLILFVCLTAALNIAVGWLWAVWYQKRLARIEQHNLSPSGDGKGQELEHTAPYHVVDQFMQSWTRLGGRVRQNGPPSERLAWTVLFSTTGALEKLLELDQQLAQPGTSSGSEGYLLRVLELASEIVHMLQDGAAIAQRLPRDGSDKEVAGMGELWSDVARQLCDVARYFSQGYQERPWAHTEETRDCIVAVSELLHTLRDVMQRWLADYYRQSGRWSGLDEDLLHERHTQLWNRLGLEREAAGFWDAVSADRPVSLVLFDVDRFRRMQQQKGLYLGEQFVNALSEFAAQQLRSERGFDRMGRLGGATFLVILGGTDLASAGRVAERLRQTVEASSFNLGDTPYEVTISCAVAAWRRGESLAEVEARLRVALEEVRRKGRNRTCLFQDEEPRLVPAEPLGVKGHVVQVSARSESSASATLDSGRSFSEVSGITGSESDAAADAAGRY
ncbi:MAG: hypothetical protein KatS3mg110_3272 [Pirellulaceae bacterium]|nr:MAG: hypothetical protein KatS3mg110_3272 [Pirellulaceae bacterium]